LSEEKEAEEILIYKEEEVNSRKEKITRCVAS
jgi:hypothetical protein